MDSAENHGKKGNPGIAIIGLGGTFPGAESVAAYWENICNNHVAIAEVPSDRWDPELFFSTDRSVPDKTYSRIGGFIRQSKFDAKRFRIPPRTLLAIDDVQKWALTSVAEALEDAGLEVFAGSGVGKPFDRDQTAVILGNAMGGEAEDRTSLRVWYAELVSALNKSIDSSTISDAERHKLFTKLDAAYQAKLPAVTEDSMPGELSNCITGRIANAFDLRGPNFTTDAACAASMAALQTAVRGLEAGEYTTAIVGGADRSMDPPTYVKFSKIGALSGEISAPFDTRASGFVMGEGVGVLILKRLDDAERDGNKIYAIIRGVGAASDGRGKGITAPNPRGQRMAIERAYASAGVPIGSVSLFEAHGTATPVGDGVELQVLNDLLKEAQAPRQGTPIGSVKSMIGHLKSAAGAASVIKAALALHHKILPPSANFQKAPDQSPLHEGYLAVNTSTRSWPVSDVPRRAGVSAFGFGGTNFHVVLEEYIPGALPKAAVKAEPTRTSVGHSSTAPAAAASRATAASADLRAEIVALFAEKTGYPISDLEPQYQLEADLGIDTVKQAEILGVIRERFNLPKDDTFRMADTPTLASIIDYVAAQRGDQPAAAAAPASAPAAPAPAAAPAAPPVSQGAVLVFGGDTPAQAIAAAVQATQQASTLNDLLAGRVQAQQQKTRLAFAVNSLEEARLKANDASRRRPKMLAAQGIYLSEGESVAKQGKVAFLFPGQGSQYLGMFRDMAARYPVVARTFEEANEVLLPLVGEKLTDIVWANPADEAADARLRETQNCQPAMLTADVALLRLLQQHGVRPQMVAGHSLGEYAAAVAAGVMTFAEALYAVSARGREMAGVKVTDNGKMAMVAADAGKVQAVLDTMSGYIIAANKNCHTQTVIAGESLVVDEAIRRFTAQGIEARQIPVSHAFHCRIVAPAAQPLERVLHGLNLRAPTTPILSNVDASYYPADKDGIVSLMAKQLASPVEFIAQLDRLYADGVRIFVEVGPRRAITGFVRNVMGEREHRAWASNHHKKPAAESFHELLAALASDGVDVCFEGTQAVAGVDSRSVAPQATAPQAATSTAAAPAPAAATPIVVSGMSVVLPSHKPVAEPHEDAWAGLLSGENYIETVSEEQRHAMLDRNVVRLNKAGGEFTRIRELGEVIQLAARFGELDICAKYGIDAGLDSALDCTSRLALAAGIDALRDAGLPLARRYRETSTGKKLPDRWALPPSLAQRTGVIMASAFPGLDTLLDEAARYAAAQGAQRSANELETFMESWASTLSDPNEAQRLRQAYAARATELRDEAALYGFNRKWLLRGLALGHAQLAQLVLAQGPNTQVNAACASGPQGIAMAQDWVRLGRCDRVLVVTCDDVTAPALMPWFGAGFLAAGAATVEPNIALAAVPFGKHRNGMILGAGATGFVIERDDLSAERGITPLAEIVAANFANSGFHATRLDKDFIADFVDSTLREVEAASHLSRGALAKRTFFMSHETYTPARGGSSAAEVEALRRGFGDACGDVLVANTKGYTGHPMGATLEDAVAIKGLQRQQLPAVANLHDVDPDFADLRLARGGAIDADYAMRFGAGFGSQIALIVYKRRATTEARLADPQAYQGWLARVSGRAGAGLELDHRTLRVAEVGGVQPWELGIASLQRTDVDAAPEPAAQPVAAAAAPAPSAKVAVTAADADRVLRELTELFAQQTGYDLADLAPDHQLEADLGIDTVKQAEIFSVLRERYGLPREDDFRLSDVQTLNQITRYVLDRLPKAAAVAPAPVVAAPAAPAPAAPAPAQPAPMGNRDREALLAEITQLFADHTGYDRADLDPTHALEADLGVDTVKQAEIFSLLRQRYGLRQDESFRLADVQTLHAVVDYVSRMGAPVAAPAVAKPAAPKPVAVAAAPASAPVAAPAKGDRTVLLAELTALFAEHTGYDPADLDPTHALEADLGIDTVKQAEIFSILRERYGLARDENFKLSDVQTLHAIVDYVEQGRAAVAAPVAVAVPVAAAAPVQAAAAPAPGGTDHASLVSELVAMFAEQTGYDRADLDPRHALEADLGIDTVKQAEIFGLIRSKYGLVQDEQFKLSDVQSIDAIAAYVLSHRKPTPPPVPTPPSDGGPTPTRPADVQTDGRFAVRPVVLVPVRPATTVALPTQGKQIVLAGGQPALQQALREALQARGAQVHRLDDGLSPAQLEERLGNLGGQPADAVIYLAPTVERRPEVLQQSTSEVFVLARSLVRARRGNVAGCGFLVLGQSGGAFGFRSNDGNALLTGALAGLVKTLAKEWPDARCVSIDLADSVSPSRGAQLALDAWLHEGPIELAWHGGAWVSPRRAPAKGTLVRAPLAPRSVVVATGGARGVTYALLLALAQEGPLRLVILNRTDGVSPQESPLTGHSAAGHKDLARAALGTLGERVTPAAIKRWIEREEVRLEIHENLQALRRLGSEVELIRCDVADGAALAQATARVRQTYGKVDLVVHGAGVEESRHLADKDDAALARAFAPKAVAALHLWEQLEPHRMVTMGSVAGRFGNAAQADYAAANELLAALARHTPGVLNIAWTAWADIGMATRGSVRQVLEALGVELIPARVAVALGKALIASELSGDVVVAGSLGSFDASEKVGLLPPRTVPALFDRVEAGEATVLTRRFDPSCDIGLDHHRIDGVPVLPGVLGLEMMAQAAAYVAQKPVTYLRAVRFAAPVKLFHDAPIDVQVEVRTVPEGLQLVLVSQFAGPGGRQVRREHFAALSVPQAPPMPVMEAEALAAPRHGPSRAAMYSRYFHGPSFQVVQTIETVGSNGADGQPIAARPQWLDRLPASGFTTQPLLRECGFQVAGLWEMAHLGRMGLPGGIDEVWLGSSTAGEALQVQARQRHVEANQCSFDVVVHNSEGRVVDLMRGYRTVTLRQLEESERFTDLAPKLSDPATLIVPLDEVAHILQGDVEAALNHYLSPAERARYETLVVQKRKLEWFAVRIAAKRLIREACAGDGTANTVPYNRITIHRDALGAPEVEIAGSPLVPRISMSHSDGIAAAFLCLRGDVRPGIDVERVEERDPSFAQTYFAEVEREHARAAADYHQALTEIWAVKEATLKALGVGARVDFRDVVVMHNEAGWQVRLRGEAATKARELATANPEVEVEVDGARVIARVLLPVRAGARPEYAHEEASA